MNSKGVNAQAHTKVDKTDKDKQALDRYTTSEAIYRLLQLTWQGIVDDTFYDNCPEIGPALFTAPYPRIAVELLGYPSANGDQKASPVIYNSDGEIVE